jgi:hypothetical protein
MACIFRITSKGDLVRSICVVLIDMEESTAIARLCSNRSNSLGTPLLYRRSRVTNFSMSLSSSVKSAFNYSLCLSDEAATISAAPDVIRRAWDIISGTVVVFFAVSDTWSV